MIKDEELDRLEQKKDDIILHAEVVEDPQKSEFEERMEVVKTNILEHASTEDQEFVEAVKTNLKEAAVKHSQVEQKRADFENKKVEFESEKLDVKRQKNQNDAIEDKWENLQKRREFHFAGVKPIMGFVGITEPMNLLILYFLTAVLTPFYLISKLLKGTFGVLIAGAANESRSKAVKGFLWTVVGLLSLLVLFAAVYLFLKWQNIDILKKYT